MVSLWPMRCPNCQTRVPFSSATGHPHRGKFICPNCNAKLRLRQGTLAGAFAVEVILTILAVTAALLSLPFWLAIPAVGIFILWFLRTRFTLEQSRAP
jgi:hypothetical protein